MTPNPPEPNLTSVEDVSRWVAITIQHGAQTVMKDLYKTDDEFLTDRDIKFLLRLSRMLLEKEHPHSRPLLHVYGVIFE